MTEPFVLHVGDVRDVLAQLPDESVDCVVTSPPYWGLRDYGINGQLGLEALPELYVTRMVAVFRDVRRVLASHGTLWLNLGDSYNNRSVGRLSSHQGGLGFESDDLSKSWADLTQEGRTRLSIENGDLKEKDLCGVPWMVAFALRADGWFLRSDIVWSKPNPMPESVTDRPTKSHEYLFLLTKQPRYFFDQEAVREPHESTRWGGRYHTQNPNGKYTPDSDVRRAAAAKARADRPDFDHYPNGGRNIRSVWEIATQPYPEAHFATFPEALPERCIKAGCPEQVCQTCGKPRERIVERTPMMVRPTAKREVWQNEDDHARTQVGGTMLAPPTAETLGWSDCGHGSYRPGVVLDPFLGSGTTALVARRLDRHAIGIELNPDYAELARKRVATYWKKPERVAPPQPDQITLEIT